VHSEFAQQRVTACKPLNIRQPCDLSGSALDREHRLDLVRLAAVDGRLAAFVVKRMDDHFEFSVAIQIKVAPGRSPPEIGVL
jgi:hypothetical protein